MPDKYSLESDLAALRRAVEDLASVAQECKDAFNRLANALGDSREEQVVMYAAGYEDEDGVLSMFAGPVPDESIFDRYPSDGDDNPANEAYVFRLYPDGKADKIAVWNGTEWMPYLQKGK